VVFRRERVASRPLRKAASGICVGECLDRELARLDSRVTRRLSFDARERAPVDSPNVHLNLCAHADARADASCETLAYIH